MRHRNLLLMVACSLLLGDLACAQTAPFSLRDGDRVVLVGGTFIERMQQHNFLETLLVTARSDRSLTIRNVGWSGDNVEGEARAVFGTGREGYDRLVKEIKQARPTVIVLAFGGNEAHRGTGGLADFVNGLYQLLEDTAATNARVVLLSPPSQPQYSSPQSDPRRFNRNARLFGEAIYQVSRQRGAHFVDLFLITSSIDAVNQGQANPALSISDNGLHLNAFGYWVMAPWLATAIDASVPASIDDPRFSWSIDIDTATQTYDAVGTKIRHFVATPDQLRWQSIDDRLPLSPYDLDRSQPTKSHVQRILRVAGLVQGRYGLWTDGEKVGEWSDRELVAGVSLTTGPPFTQLAQLQRAIEEKNRLYFHRYRPQNETYLFLFRKHEQGNNAVEIPQFDEHIAAQESKISQLKRPVEHDYRLQLIER